MSNNNFGGGIPYQLPPNLQQLYVSYVYLFPVLLFTLSRKIFGDLLHYCFVCRNLANDNFNGAAPYSISLMTSLKYLWVISSYSLLDATFLNIQTNIFSFSFWEHRNISHNQLQNQLSDMFGQLSSLSTL
jgi:hypothetical protein